MKIYRSKSKKLKIFPKKLKIFSLNICSNFKVLHCTLNISLTSEFKNSTAVLLNDYNDTSIFTNLTNTIIFIDQSMTEQQFLRRQIINVTKANNKNQVIHLYHRYSQMAALVSIPLTKESPYTKDPINEQIARPNAKFFCIIWQRSNRGYDIHVS